MIFVTVGTQGPFNRLIEAVDAWCAETPEAVEVFGQIGVGAPGEVYTPQHFDWVDRMPPREFQVRAQSAKLIVSHAGMGTIISALQHNRELIVMPRRFHLGEHRNDHQLATVRQLGSRPRITAVEEASDLSPAITHGLERAQTTKTEPISEFADPAFTEALKRFIREGDRG